MGTAIGGPGGMNYIYAVENIKDKVTIRVMNKKQGEDMNASLSARNRSRPIGLAPAAGRPPFSTKRLFQVFFHFHSIFNNFSKK